MHKITEQCFIETYKPIENIRFPTFDTIIPQNHCLNKYIWDIREKTLISEYIPNRCFFSVIKDKSSGEYYVLPGNHNSLARAYIITTCPYSPERLYFTIVKNEQKV
jgi:hypothetical protein